VTAVARACGPAKAGTFVPASDVEPPAAVAALPIVGTLNKLGDTFARLALPALDEAYQADAAQDFTAAWRRRVFVRPPEPSPALGRLTGANNPLFPSGPDASSAGQPQGAFDPASGLGARPPQGERQPLACPGQIAPHRPGRASIASSIIQQSHAPT
jgi:hypothetical protein